MYIKRGTLENPSSMDGNDLPILTGPGGKRYEVSYVAAFIWNMLDGTRPLHDVAKKVQATARIESNELLKVTQKIVTDLQNANLAEELQNVVFKR